MMTGERSRILIGFLIAVFAIAAFFWWGTHFAIFGTDIDWIARPVQLGTPLLTILGAFGAGFASGGARLGIKALIWTSAILGAAILVGVIRSALGAGF